MTVQPPRQVTAVYGPGKEPLHGSRWSLPEGSWTSNSIMSRPFC